MYYVFPIPIPHNKKKYVLKIGMNKNSNSGED